MENAGKLEEQLVENHYNENHYQGSSVPTEGRLGKKFPKDTSCEKKGKGRNSVLIKQEERETGIVSWKVLMRYDSDLQEIEASKIFYIVKTKKQKHPN